MNKKVVIFWSIFIAAAIFRVWHSFDIKPPVIDDCLKQVVTGIGIVDEEPERKETGQILVVDVESLKVEFGGTNKTLSGAVTSNALDAPNTSNINGISNIFGIINTPNTSSTTDSVKQCTNGFLIRMKTKLYPRFVYGDRILFTGKLLQPVNFSSGSDRAFDYKGYLAKDDIYYEIKSAKVSTTSLTSLDHGTSALNNRISSALFSFKRRFVNNLERTLGEPHAALAAGLVVGEKAALGKDLLDDFRTVGLIHIVVLSGYNITVVGDAMRRILSFLPRVWGIAFGGVGIALFGVLVGGGATVVRSCFMAGVALSADFIRRDYNVTRALIFAGLIMLIQNPMILLHDPSFQLSFLATLGLIILASPIEKRLSFITEKFGIRGIVASTIATQIFVSPYILYMMGQISIIGMVVNILVLPTIPITMLFVFLTGMAGTVFMPIAQVFGWISYFLLSYELYMVQHFARLPFASVNLPVFSGWWVVAFYSIFTFFYIVKGLRSYLR